MMTSLYGDLETVSEGDRVSVRTWSSRLLGGRPRGRLQSGLGRRPGTQ